MVWIIGIVVVIVIIGAISSAASKSEEVQKKTEFNEMARSRVDAYVDFVRRTSNRSEFARMSDLELKDLIGQKIRAYKSQISGAQGICSFILFAGVAVAAWFGVSDRSWSTFFVLGAIALTVAVGLLMFLTNKINEGFAAAGFDPDRLKIEE